MVTGTRYASTKQQELRSRHQLSERFVEFGWLPTVPEDLGEDFIVQIYYDGRPTGVNFYVQEKSVTNLQERRKGDYVPYPFKVKDLTHWERFEYPVVLIIWDVNPREGRWALLHTVIEKLDQQDPDWRRQKTKILCIPWQNTTDKAGLVQLRRSIGQHLYPLITGTKANEVEEVFPDWLRQEAVRLSRLLVEKFDVESVYLFGSLAWGERVTPETDIDLAISGLPSEQYFKAIGYFEQVTDFGFDLVDLDSTSDRLRQRVLSEGKRLYDRGELVGISE